MFVFLSCLDYSGQLGADDVRQSMAGCGIGGPKNGRTLRTIAKNTEIKSSTTTNLPIGRCLSQAQSGYSGRNSESNSGPPTSPRHKPHPPRLVFANPDSIHRRYAPHPNRPALTSSPVRHVARYATIVPRGVRKLPEGSEAVYGPYNANGGGDVLTRVQGLCIETLHTARQTLCIRSGSGHRNTGNGC